MTKEALRPLLAPAASGPHHPYPLGPGAAVASIAVQRAPTSLTRQPNLRLEN